MEIALFSQSLTCKKSKTYKDISWSGGHFIPPPPPPLAKDTHILDIPRYNCSSARELIITDRRGDFYLLANSPQNSADEDEAFSLLG